MAVVKSTKRKIKANKALYNAILYVTNPNKVFAVSYGNGEPFSNSKDTTELYKMIRKSKIDQTGIIAHHYIQSFSPTDKITVEEVNKIGIEFAQKAFPNYQVIVATHNDCEHLHNHFILCAFSTEGEYKWADKTETREYLQNISDELCVKNNLSVIESRGKGLDQATYQLGLRGKSWKFALTCDLDEAMKFCKTKDEFINFLYLRGYSVKYSEKNITITKDGEKKGIRVDTLAKQFGSKYTKLYLEKAMGFWERPKEFIRIEPHKKPVKSTYNGEWARFEKYLFEQINKPEITETDKFMSNISLKEILESQGKNFKGEIDLLELIKLKELDCFFYARKCELTAIVMVKEYNEEKLKSKVTVLEEVDKILLREKREKSQNAKLNSEIKQTAQNRGEKPGYRVITETEFRKLQEKKIQFAYFQRGDKYNIVFLKEYANDINKALNSAILGQ